MAMRSAIAAALLLLPCVANAREEIRVVGSSTVFPLVAAVAEQFGRATGHRTPVVESTGTGGGFKVFCEGAGDATPDISNASRAIKPSEIELCKKNGVTGITELALGFDGIVFANALQSPAYKLTRHDLFLAMAREVPKNGELVPNFYQRWKEIDASLPDAPIEIYGPPPVEGTRDALVELVMVEGCKQSPEYAAHYPDEKTRKVHCEAMREDGKFTELLGGNLMVQKLVNNHDALAIFGYSYLEQNMGLVKANAVEGVAPTPETISNGTYSVARTLYVYVKNQHADAVPGLRDFVAELTSDAAVGEDGYLVLKGLLPLPQAQHEKIKEKANAL